MLMSIRAKFFADSPRDAPNGTQVCYVPNINESEIHYSYCL